MDKPESFPEDHSETTIGKQHDLKVINEEQRETRSQQDLREEPTKMTAEEGAKVEMTSLEDAKVNLGGCEVGIQIKEPSAPPSQEISTALFLL